MTNITKIVEHIEKTTYQLPITPNNGDILMYSETNQEFVPTSLNVNNRFYKVYTALLTQTNTNLPNVTILENTLGHDINWIVSSTNSYYTQEEFNPSKTFIILNNSNLQELQNTIKVGYTFGNNIYVYQYHSETLQSLDVNFPISLEIRVYP